MLDHLLCILDIVGYTALYKLLHNEGLKELYSHLLGQTALPDL